MNADERINLTPAQQVDQQLHVAPPLHQRSRKNQVQYQLKQVIGKGSYGIVYRAINRKTEQVVAIKEVTYDDDEELRDIMSEIDLLKNLNHINIVKYHGFIKKSHNLYIILEYCSHGSLKNIISRGRGIPEAKAKVFVKQTLNGLLYLHEQGVIHRDIKAANLLLDSNNVVKLADFGVSTKVNTMTMAMTLAGSLNWMAPEIIGNRGASTLSDIWSLGATVLELLTGNPPFHNLVDVNIYYAIENDTFIPPATMSQDVQDFLSSCFQKNMYKRPTAAQLLKYKWLSNTNTNKLEIFKEDSDESDYRWDHDFKESKIVDIAGMSSGFIRNDEISNNNNSTLRSSQDILCRLSKGESSNLSNDSLALLFNQSAEQDIYLKMIELSRSADNQELLIALFEYDKDFNGSKLKKSFIKMGGIPEVMNHSPVIERFFLKDCYRTLIECGILRSDNLKLLSDSLKLELIFKYLEVSDSSAFWCNWCSQNLSVSTLISNLSNKFAQSIILKLSFLDDTSYFFYAEFIEKLLTLSLNELQDEHLLSFIFKALSSILIKFHKRSPPSSMAPSPSLSQFSHSSPHSSPASTSKTIALSNPQTALKLPASFLPWLLEFLSDPSFYKIRNLHIWKYYFLVIHHSTHLNKPLLNKLLQSNSFLKLILRFLIKKNDHCFSHEECHLPIVQMSLSITTEICFEMNSFNPILQNVALAFLNFSDECIAGGLEVLFNHLQFALHNNLKIVKSSKGLSIVSPTTSSSSSSTDLTKSLNYEHLLSPFFSIHENNIQFGNFIAKFAKIFSLAPLDIASMDIILHPDFINRSVLFFELYRNSLLIQIDLLKFVKLVFGRALDYYHSKVKSTNPLRKDALRCIVIKLQEMNAFLDNNWNSQQAGQVGCDSILIHQLCRDIKSLSMTSTS